ncbi:unnamed protein product [Echinostoma caproni]|uniref:Uncharacterized protein n=1 Tax=Echinostoma caproni TaxID=27848 RepID=A0A183B4J9_9TREM|nr:unnamed protein product [Echinostoma caproni]
MEPGISSQLDECCELAETHHADADPTSHSVSIAPNAISVDAGGAGGDAGCSFPLTRAATTTNTILNSPSHALLGAEEGDEWIPLVLPPHRYHPSAPSFGMQTSLTTMTRTTSSTIASSSSSSSIALSSPRQQQLLGMPCCVQSPVDSIASDGISEVELGTSASGPPTSSTNVLTYAIRGILQWAEALVASRQTASATEPIHQVAMCTLNEAVDLLVSLNSSRRPTDSRSPVGTPTTSSLGDTPEAVTMATHSVAMDALTAALVSPVPEFESSALASSLAPDEILDPVSRPMPVQVHPSDGFRRIFGHGELPRATDEAAWSSLPAPISLSVAAAQQHFSSTTFETSSPPSRPQSLAPPVERRSLDTFESFCVPGLGSTDPRPDWRSLPRSSDQSRLHQ